MDDPSSRNGPQKSRFTIDRVLNNPATEVKIYASGVGTIRGVLVSDFSFGIGSEYQSLFDIAEIEQLSTNVNRLTSVLNAASSAGLIGLGKIPQLRLKSPGLTSKQFMGAKDLRFSVDILLLQYSNEESLKKKIDTLSSMCLPTIQQFNNKIGVGIYRAPLGYSGEVLSTNSSGSVAVSIGKWFEANSQIVYDVTFGMSRVASDAAGTPLYATVNVQFGPSIEVGAGEFQSYFKEAT